MIRYLRVVLTGDVWDVQGIEWCRCATQEMDGMAKKPADAAPAAPAQPAVPPVLEDRLVTVSFLVPESLHYGLKVRAAQERTTVRGMVLRGLKAIGLDVPDDELNDRRPGRAGRPRGR